MMVQRTVMKVNLSCQKCKKRLLRAVSGLEGVEKIEIDAVKSTLTVTGTADPYKIVVRSRKINKFAEIVTIGPPAASPKQDAPKKPDEKKPEGKKPEQKPQDDLYHTCPVCEESPLCVPYQWHSDESNMSCTIL
ncbi:hypothetical protein GIB67_004899 [Kingdonia uniflora]|uniref:HMA domain-containing protein n=1 Tax=Kingdonia uniflora TaxID=39325 RepID=A0A7J7LNJ4_9MAGN|nr:hypothetical protein GIB67_004899 [Kingdonia uniflora]